MLDCGAALMVFTEVFMCLPTSMTTVEEYPASIVVAGERDASRFRLVDLSRQEALFTPRPIFPYPLGGSLSARELTTAAHHCSQSNGRLQPDCSFGVVSMTLTYR